MNIQLHYYNSKKSVENSKVVLHEIYCFRNIIQCSLCPEYYDKRDPESHLEIHSLIQCKLCGQYLEQRDFQDHQEKSCENKPKFCRFCETSIVRNDFIEHVVQCSSRTKECYNCGKNIILKYLDDHEEICIYEKTQNIKSKDIFTVPTTQQKQESDKNQYNYEYEDDYYDYENVYDSNAEYSQDLDEEDNHDENNHAKDVICQNKSDQKKQEDVLIKNDNKNNDAKKDQNQFIIIDDDDEESENDSQEKQNQKNNENISVQQNQMKTFKQETKKILLKQNNKNGNGIQDKQNSKIKMFSKLDSMIEQRITKQTRGEKNALENEDEQEYNNYDDSNEKEFQNNLEYNSDNSISDDKSHLNKQTQNQIFRQQERNKLNSQESETQVINIQNSKKQKESTQNKNHLEQASSNNFIRRQQQQELHYFNEDEELQKAIQESLLYQ